ncbi:hypothetical protein FA95DRAFT_1559093 [Auriscalpium vulgare]|uniref:Uncharacterized protein n=1 Tax=Auriscalpium vulgare TaxID=40419 RepID=A0ACB8RVA7_9AGAM|nr:hypothetical protein FA95DRAFT_1559093 [Auriscalpium vulgare]
MVFAIHLDKITDLRGDDFVGAWVDCVKGHYRLWTHGICDVELNVSNLACSRGVEAVLGVLKDWDIAGEGQERERRHSNAPLFMPLVLLSDKYWEGKMLRTYFHDIESFVWIFAYVFLWYDATESTAVIVDRWMTGDYKTCRVKKNDFLYGGEQRLDLRKNPPSAWRCQWPLASALLAWVRHRHIAHFGAIFDGTQLEATLAAVDHAKLLELVRGAGYDVLFT